MSMELQSDRNLLLLITLIAEGGTKDHVRKEWLRQTGHEETALKTFYRARRMLPDEVQEAYKHILEGRQIRFITPDLVPKMKEYLEDRLGLPEGKRPVSWADLLAYFDGVDEWKLEM